MPDMEKVLEDFEYAVRRSHGDGWDYVDGLTTEDGFKILQLLKEQKEIVHCADCRYAEVSPSGLIKCRGIFRSKEWFCADGLRKEEE